MRIRFLKQIWVQYGDILGKSILHPQYFTIKAGYEGVKLAKKYAKGTLLDIGCGRMPYRTEIEPLVDKYIGLDHPLVSRFYHSKWKPDILAEATKIPLKDGSVDTVLLLQVLEHLDDPGKALSEMYRILKPGGFVVGALPFFYPIHDNPYDMARYTDQMLRSLFERSGFQVVVIKAEGSFVGEFAQSVNVFFMMRINDILRSQLSFVSVIYLCLLIVLAPFSIVLLNAFGSFFLLLGKLLPEYPNHFPIDYCFVVKKAVSRGVSSKK